MMISGKARKAAVSLFALAFLIILLTGCAFNQDGIIATGRDADASAVDETTLAETFTGYTDFASKQIGVNPGSVFDQVTEQIDAIPAYYNEMPTAVEDVRKNRIYGYMTDLAVAKVFIEAPGNEDLQYIVVPAEVFTAPMGAISASQKTIDLFNMFLSEIEADGTMDDMKSRWLETAPNPDIPMPEIPLTGENGPLRIATTAATIPFSFFGEYGELKGYCIELALRFAAKEGKSVEFSAMDLSAFIPYIVSERADIGIDALYITEERMQSVLFSEPYANDLAAIITLKDFTAVEEQEDEGFIQRLRTSIERNLITDNRWRLIVDGLGVTLLISLAAQICGTIFGCFVCYLLTRKSKPVRWIANLYCGLIRGTPVVVLLMITYYIIFGNTNISNIIIAIAAFTLVTGAITGQTLKGAIDTVDEVEIEAARSIGFSAFRAFTAVTLPQAVRRAMPGYTGGFVELVKLTAIVGFIAIQDLTRAANIIQSRTFDVYFPLLLIAAIYLIITTIFIQLFKLVINKINYGGEQK